MSVPRFGLEVRRKCPTDQIGGKNMLTLCLKRHFLGTSNSKWGNQDYVSTIKLRVPRKCLPGSTSWFPRFTNGGTEMLTLHDSFITSM